MKKRTHRRLITILPLFICALFFSITAYASVDSLNISQIVQEGNDIYLYTDVLDYQGIPSSDSLSADKFSVGLDGKTTIKAQDVAVADAVEGTCYLFCIDVSKSVTDTEMSEIHSGLSGFINGMGKEDYACIITIGQTINKLCELTNDRSALISAVESVQRSDMYTYLYQGISVALDTQRTKKENLPKRTAIILFSDGCDDSDGAYGENDILKSLEELHIPIYVVGLGKDTQANLNSVANIARTSGGALMSYSNYSTEEAVQAIEQRLAQNYRIQIKADAEEFRNNDGVHTWQVYYGEEGAITKSPGYEFSLSLDGMDNADSINKILLVQDNVEYEAQVIYNGEEQKPSVKVRLDGKTLQENKDYIIQYGNNTYVDVGEYAFVVKGTGAYGGEIDLDYTITAAELTADDVSLETNLSYTGDVQSPDLRIKIEGRLLEEDIDYILDLDDKEWKDVGKYNIGIKGIGNYFGTVKDVCSIEPAELTEENLEYQDVVTYNGQNQKLEGITVFAGSSILEEKKDYVIDFGRQEWKDAGEYSFTVTGKGNYGGNVTAYFTIEPYPISSEDITYKESGTYSGEDQKPEDISVIVDGTILKPEDDYNVNIDSSDWIQAGTYNFTVTGNGNYGGEVDLEYSISKNEIVADNVEYNASVIFNGEAQKPDSILISVNGKTLSEGQDYSVTYVGEEWVEVDNYSFIVEGQGSYAGELELAFEIEPAKISLDQIEYENEAVYTGESLKPSDIVVRVGGRVLEEGKDYTLDFGNEDWIEAGEYKFTVTGIGNYTGTTAADYVIWAAKGVKLKNSIVKFVRANLILIIVIAAALIILGVVFMILLRKKKRAKKAGYPSDPTIGRMMSSDPMLDKTIPENREGEDTIAEESSDEETIGSEDDEATTDTGIGSTRLTFEITFNGRTQILERYIREREQLILGRGDHCDIDVVLGSQMNESKQTSRQHAIIENREDGLYILDRSKNKTYLNNKAINGEELICNGDTLTMGMARVRVMIQLS